MSTLKLPSMPKMGRMPRPPRNRAKPPVAPRGPRIYHRGNKPLPGDSRWMNPPPGFVGAHTSATEWMIYLALHEITKQPKDPYHAPFIGGPPIWTYQKAQAGGNVVGGSQWDFVVLSWKGVILLGIRIETERYHIWTDGKTQQRDIQRRSHYATVERTVRIFDQHFIDDPTGEKACRVTALALQGIELPSPVFFGTAERVRP